VKQGDQCAVPLDGAAHTDSIRFDGTMIESHAARF
jgi:hypothetical protein